MNKNNLRIKTTDTFQSISRKNGQSNKLIVIYVYNNVLM